MKMMDLQEFRAEGYLSEVNRQFFHPLGLALEIKITELPEDEDPDTDKYPRYDLAVQDHRDDPEGVIFTDPSEEKMRQVHALQMERIGPRVQALGYWVQPVGIDHEQLLMERITTTAAAYEIISQSKQLQEDMASEGGLS